MTSSTHTWMSQRSAVRARRDRVRKTIVPPPSAADFASNDYLGLAADQRLVQAADAALQEYGVGASASRVVTGTHPEHMRLEKNLAELTGAGAALVFSSGYTANVGALTALGGPGCTIALDAHCHASLHDAARLSRAQFFTFAHNDVAAAQRILAERNTPRALVVTESIFSVLGDRAPVAQLHALAVAHDALCVVDEAHGIGVAGNGSGLVAECGLAGDDHIVLTATLSKALGSQGGAVIGSDLVREHIVNDARAFIFDTALAPSLAAAAACAVQIIGAEPERIARLHQTAAAIAALIDCPQTAGAVQSLPMASASAASAAANRFSQRKVLVGCFRPPSVPDGVSRLRFTARANTSAAELALLEQLLGQLSHDRQPS